MISSRRSRVQPPQSPSAVSASPSSCSPPLSITSTPSANSAATGAGRPSASAALPASAASAPSTAPASGQAQAARAPRVPSATGTGSRVSSPNASAMSDMRTSAVSWSVPGMVTSFSGVGAAPLSRYRRPRSLATRPPMPAPFATLADVAALLRGMPGPDEGAIAAARARDAVLTKPPGALGRLEEVAAWYCGWRGDPRARVEGPQVVVFAGNHGVVAQGVSAFPPEVTAQMIANFEAGGAAVNQLAGVAGARLDVHALDLDRPTGDIATGPAMREAACVAALATGWEAVDPQADLFVAGEMGIGNTTPAAAI